MNKKIIKPIICAVCAVFLIILGLILLLRREHSAYDTVVFTVGDEEVRMDEVNLCILQNVVDLSIDADKLDVSEDVLKTLDADSADEYYKQKILEVIMDYKIESMIAKKQGISLSEDEENTVSSDVTDYMGKTNARVLNELGITRNRVLEIYRQRYLAYKLVEKTKASVKSDDADKKFSTIYLMLFPKIETTDDGGFVTDEEDGSLLLLSDEEIVKRREDAEAAHRELTEDNASPDDVAVKYGVEMFSGEKSDFIENFGDPFAENIEKLKEGECSSVIEIDSCYAIIKLLRENNEQLTEQVMELYQNDLEKEELEKKKEEWYKELNVDSEPHFIGGIWEKITLYDFIKYAG